MLICLGGFIGSGRRFLARKLARNLKFHYYDIDQKRSHIPVAPGKSARGLTWRPAHMPRMVLYRRVLEDLPRLSKMYLDVVVDAGFPRAISRDFFFSEARKYFDDVLFVWVELDEESVRRKLNKRDENFAKWSVHKRELTKNEFQAPDPSTTVFKYTGGDFTDETLEAFYDLVREKLKASR